MAREQKTQISDRPGNSPYYQPISEQQPLQAQVHPVDQFVAPAENQILGLANGLAKIHPQLEQYLGHLQQQQDEKDFLKGQQARMEQQGNGVAANTEQTHAFRVGYMTMHGQVMGQQAANELMGQYEQNKNTPGFDPDALISKFKANDLAGMNSPNSLKGYLQAMGRTEAHIRQDFVQTQVAQVREQRRTMVSQQATDILENSANPQDAHGQYLQWRQTARNLGLTNPEISQVMTDTLIARALDKGPDELRMAYVEDTSGMSLAKSSPEIAEKLERAEKQATALQEHRVKKAMEPILAAREVAIEKQLLLDPLSLGKPEDIISLNPDIYDTSEKQVSLVRRWYAARQSKEAGVPDVDGDKLLNSDDDFVRSLMGRTDADSKIWRDAIGRAAQRRYDSIIGQINPDDKASVAAGLAQIKDLYKHKLVEPQALKGIIAALPKLSLEPDGSVPRGARIALQFYAQLSDENDGMVNDLFSVKDKVFAATFWSAVQAGRVRDADAFRQAQTITNSEIAKDRKERYASPKQLKEVGDAASGLLDTLMKVDSVYSRSNGKDLRIELEKAFERIVTGTNADPETAKELAAKDVAQGWMLLKDPTGLYPLKEMFVKVPSEQRMGMSREALNYALPKLLAARADEDKKHDYMPDVPYGAVLNTRGDAFLLFKGDVLVGQVDFKTLHDSWAADKGKTTPQITQGNETIQRFSPQVVPPSVTKPTPANGGPNPHSDEDIIRMGNQVRDDFNKGRLDAGTFARFVVRERQARENILRREEAGSIERARNGGNPNMDFSTLYPKTTVPSHLGTNPDGLKMPQDRRAIDYANAETNPTKQAIMVAEGLATRLYPDPANKAGMNIGYGYNVSSRSHEQVIKDFKRAGINNPDEVLAGKAAITPEQASRLIDVVLPDYINMARSAVGDETWKKLSPHAQAAMVNVAYASKDINEFKGTIEHIQNGDLKAAADNFSITYVPRGQAKKVRDQNRIGIVSSLLRGPAYWQARLAESQRVTPK